MEDGAAWLGFLLAGLGRRLSLSLERPWRPVVQEVVHRRGNLQGTTRGPRYRPQPVRDAGRPHLLRRRRQELCHQGRPEAGGARQERPRRFEPGVAGGGGGADLFEGGAVLVLRRCKKGLTPNTVEMKPSSL